MRTHKILKSTLQKEFRTSRTRKTSLNQICGYACNGSLSILSEENESGLRNIGTPSMDFGVSVPNQYCARNGEDFAIFHRLKTSLNLLKLTFVAQKSTNTCKDLVWTHDKSTPHRTETNGIARTVVRRKRRDFNSVGPIRMDEKRWERICAMQHARLSGR